MKSARMVFVLMGPFSFWQTLLASALLLGAGCSSVDNSSYDFDRVGQFDSFASGVSEARFKGRSVASGWYFGVCGQSFDLEELSDEIVCLNVVNAGPAIWVDYLTGSAFLQKGDSVVVYEGTLVDLVKRCDAREWQWVAFKYSDTDSGFVKMLVIMRFANESVNVSAPIALNAWYSVEVNP